MSTSGLYMSDVGILRQYTDTNFKLVHMSLCRQKGIETDDFKFTAKGEAGNDCKLENNLARAKSAIIELSLCNSWEFFCTFTLDKSKYNRHDLKKFNKDFSQFLRDYRKKYGLSIQYLFIPETHKDGAWHMHGFLHGLPLEHLKEFTLEDNIPEKIKARIRAGKHVFTWLPYWNKFGFSDIELIENHEAASHYITKYVTKDILNASRELNAHLYYVSKGLERSKIVYRDTMAKSIDKPDYQNEHVTVKRFDNVSEPMRYFCDYAD